QFAARNVRSAATVSARLSGRGRRLPLASPPREPGGRKMRKAFWGLFCGVFAAAAGPALAQISDDVVRIGILTDMAGPYADINGQGSVIATRMAVEDFGGRVLGKPIEILVADHQNKADVAATIAREWIDQQKVDAITNMTNSAAALAV